MNIIFKISNFVVIPFFCAVTLMGMELKKLSSKNVDEEKITQALSQISQAFHAETPSPSPQNVAPISKEEAVALKHFLMNQGWVINCIHHDTRERYLTYMLGWAASNNYEHIVQKILELIRKDNFISSKASASDINDAFWAAVDRNNCNLLKIFLDECPKIIDRADDNDDTAITFAASRKPANMKTIKLLITYKPDLEWTNRERYSALAYSLIDSNKLAIAQALLDAGANPNGKAPEKFKSLLAYILSRSDCNKGAELLISRNADVNMLDSVHGTPLHVCAKKNAAGILLLLKQEKLQIDARIPKTGRTALMIAADEGNVEAVETLIKKSLPQENKEKSSKSIYANPWLTDHKKETALEIAKRKKDEEQVEEKKKRFEKIVAALTRYEEKALDHEIEFLVITNNGDNN